MLLLTILVIGMFTGWIAQLLLGARNATIDWGEALVAGLVGSFVGGTAASLLAGDGFDIRPSGLVGSIAGALVVTAVYGWIRGRRTA